MEQYKTLKDFPNYEINTIGTIRRIKSKRVIKTRVHKGYTSITLRVNGKRYFKNIHRLVTETFIPNPENKPFVDHIDRDKLNNNVSNLRWTTRLENNVNRLYIKDKPFMLFEDDTYIVGYLNITKFFKQPEQAFQFFKQLTSS